MRYAFQPQKSTLYLRFGGKTRCNFRTMARVGLDCIDEQSDDEIRDAIISSLFWVNMHPKHISIERSIHGVAIYTTGNNTIEGTYIGCVLHWSPDP